MSIEKKSGTSVIFNKNPMSVKKVQEPNLLFKENLVLGKVWVRFYYLSYGRKETSVELLILMNVELTFTGVPKKKFYFLVSYTFFIARPVNYYVVCSFCHWKLCSSLTPPKHFVKSIIGSLLSNRFVCVFFHLTRWFFSFVWNASQDLT